MCCCVRPSPRVESALCAAATPVQVSGGEGAAEVSITDAIPACHSFISLAPMLEAALSQVGWRGLDRG